MKLSLKEENIKLKLNNKKLREENNILKNKLKVVSALVRIDCNTCEYQLIDENANPYRRDLCMSKPKNNNKCWKLRTSQIRPMTVEQYIAKDTE